MIWAHRGASGYAPENTLEAFQTAIEQDADGIELDVHLSRDGEVMVAHDETVDRVSDGTGRIADMTVAELKKLVFSKTMPAFKEARIPTLREVFALMQPTRLSVNIELKTNVFAYEGIEGKCIALIREYGLQDRVIFSSFNHHSLLNVKRIDAKLPCGILYAGIMVRPWEYARALGFDALHPHYSELAVPREVADSHACGIRVNVWTVNEEERLAQVIAKHPDGIITNFPDRARRMLS
jgi:glycerophosphoryl diester phosphodiesterase